MLKDIYKKPHYIALFIILVLGYIFWIQDRLDQRDRLRPAQIVKNLPKKTRKSSATKNEFAPKSIKSENKASKEVNPIKLEKPAAESSPEKKNTEAIKTNVAKNPREMEAQELLGELQVVSGNLKKASKKELQRNIAVAEALIEKDPEFYPAYKSKLMSLLIQEIQHGEQIEIEDYEELYDEMLSFEGVSFIDETLAEVRGDQENSENLSSSELEGIDQDLIHIPFLRFSALNDVESLADISEEYIEDFPDSYIGYLYLAEALWKDGDQTGATETLLQGLKEGGSDEMVLRLFSVFQKSPSDRLYKLSSE